MGNTPLTSRFPSQTASNAVLWSFPWYEPDQSFEQIVELSGNFETSWRPCDTSLSLTFVDESPSLRAIRDGHRPDGGTNVVHTFPWHQLTHDLTHRGARAFQVFHRHWTPLFRHRNWNKWVPFYNAANVLKSTHSKHAITVTSHELHVVSNHRPFGCLFNSLLRLTSKKTSKLRYSSSVRGIHRPPAYFTHKGPVTRKVFPFHDIIMPWLAREARAFQKLQKSYLSMYE